MLEQRRVPLAVLVDWACGMPYAQGLRARYFLGERMEALVERAVAQLTQSGALRQEDGWVVDA